ncbi:hypothetical protein G5I_03064 [Acromyrmex echinatior]|uniref:Uncharacterized protein n=1 Tax=Acromyrmex echinatior TaxID=103372 RepID=F4WBZ3_ACREC|nr:hypothetical protein G5I_03064 [Acromyrmex echinatior]
METREGEGGRGQRNEEAKEIERETTKFILLFRINLVCFFSFSCAMTQNTLGPQKAFIHHWLCTEKEKKTREREDGNRKTRRLWARNWEEKKRDRGRDTTRFWQTQMAESVFVAQTGGRQPYVFFLRDDSYQTENKGSVMMNKKKSLSVSNPSILDRSNYTQLARLQRRIDRCNKQLLLLNAEKHIRETAAQGESGINGAQRISAIRHARFPPRARPSSRKESRLVTIYVFLRVMCLAMKVPFVAAIIVKNVDPQRVSYLVHRDTYASLRRERVNGWKSRQYAPRHPRRVNGATLEDGSFTICPRRGAVSKCPSGAIKPSLSREKDVHFLLLSRTRRDGPAEKTD